MAIEYAPIELSHHRITSISDELKGISLPIPFVSNYVNIWFLKVDDGWAVFDCGFNDSPTKQTWEEIIFKEIFPIKAIIVSHFHLDHAALCGWVSQRTDAPIYASREEWLMMHFLKYEPEKIGFLKILYSLIET